MINNWVLHVKEFGKIEQADIEIAPLTLFIGDNNSGKSYLLSLLWGFISDKVPILIDEELENKQYSILSNELSSILNQENITNYSDIQLSDNFVDTLLDYTHTSIQTYKDIAVSFIFNYLDINCKSIEIDHIYNNNISVLNDVLRRYIFFIYSIKLKSEDNIDVVSRKVSIFFMNILSLILGTRGTIEDIFLNNALYLPTARTGFVLTYKTLLKEATNVKFNIEVVEKNLLTRPVTEFLKIFTELSESTESTKFKEVIKFIENYLIDGKITNNKLPVTDITFIPNESNVELPMFLSSSVVTELVPLILSLKYTNDFRAIIIEEPEMCLHPKLQWMMARVIIKIVNLGIPVFVSTHSDIILQHINNMIKLNTNAEKPLLMNKYGYSEDDIIKPEDIRMYQFDMAENHKTKVTKLDSGIYGFKAPTFNNMLKELLEQSREFE